MTRRRRDGFALLAVLWMLGGAAVLSLLLLVASRDARQLATNRVALARARWIVEGCVERARSAVDDAVADEVIDDSTWAHLDRLVDASLLVRGCNLAVVPDGMTLDVNLADAGALQRFLLASGLSAVASDSVLSAILDWRDPDDDPRSSGAERGWYSRAERVPPRNADIAATQELASIRGLEGRDSIVRMLDLESHRVLLSHAPSQVLASLPGLGPSALSEIARRRDVGDSVITLLRLAQLLDSAARSDLLAHLSALNELTVALPAAWTFVDSTTATERELSTRLEVRVVRAGRRLAVLRKRSDS